LLFYVIFALTFPAPQVFLSLELFLGETTFLMYTLKIYGKSQVCKKYATKVTMLHQRKYNCS